MCQAGCIHIGELNQQVAALSQENAVLSQENTVLSQENTVLSQELKLMQEAYRLSQERQFGHKSEQSNPNQPDLFDDQEFADSLAEAKVLVIPEHTRNKKTHPELNGRVDLPAHLEREEILLDLPETEKAGLIKIGEDVTEQLAIRPAKLYVKHYVRPKYAQPTAKTQGVKAAELPPHPLNRCKADVSLISHLIENKYSNYLPLFRQRQMLERLGVTLAESTMNNWVGGTATVLEDLYGVLKSEVLRSEILNVDETRLNTLLPKEKTGKCRKDRKIAQGRLWSYLAQERKLVCFEFTEHWRHEHPVEEFKNFRGYLQTDGYEGYAKAAKKNSGIVHIGCWAHVRRKFLDANVTPNPTASKFLVWINLLYRIEHRIAAFREADRWSGEELLELRKKRAGRVLKKLFAEAKQTFALPKSLLGSALRYLVTRESELRNYLLDPRLTLDNNPVENAIRPVVIGRKNFLFVGSPEAGKHAALFCSLAGCCRLNKVNFGEYLNDLLPRLTRHRTTTELRELLPDRWEK